MTIFFSNFITIRNQIRTGVTVWISHSSIYTRDPGPPNQIGLPPPQIKLDQNQTVSYPPIYM